MMTFQKSLTKKYFKKISPVFLMMILFVTFFSPCLLKEEIYRSCNAKLFAVNRDDPT